MAFCKFDFLKMCRKNLKEKILKNFVIQTKISKRISSLVPLQSEKIYHKIRKMAPFL